MKIPNMKFCILATKKEHKKISKYLLTVYLVTIEIKKLHKKPPEKMLF